MSYTVLITETNVSSVTFDSKEEAEQWIQDPDYDYVRGWECVESKLELHEDEV